MHALRLLTERLALLALFLAPLRGGAEQVLGPLPKEISAWTEEVKATQRIEGQRMLSRVEDALERGEKAILVPKGDYRFSRKEGTKEPQLKLDLSQYTGVTIDFQESTLWFETPDIGLDLVGGANTIRNFTVDWDPLPYVQGKVMAIDEKSGTFRVRLDPGYETAEKSLPNGIREGRAFFFDDDGNFVVGQAGCSIYFKWSRKTDEGDYLVGYGGFYGVPISAGGFKVGDRVALLVRQGIGLRMFGGREGFLIENVRFYASPSLVFMTAGGHSPTLRNCAIQRRPGTNRLMSGNADGFNFANTSRGPIMENCRIEGAIGDDFVNVHGHLARVIWQESPTELIVTRMNWRGDFNTPVAIEFFDRKTMKSYGKRSATGKLMFESWKVEKDRCRADLAHAWHSGDAAGLIEGNKISVHRITLDAPFEIQDDMIVACDDFSGSGAMIRNCSFHGSPAFGLRMQAPNVTIEDNVIENVGGAGITLFGQAGFWGEGPIVHHAKVVGNTIRNTGLFAPEKNTSAGIVIGKLSPASEILVQGNTFINPGGAAIIATGVDGLRLEGNTIIGHYNLPPSSPDQSGGQGYGVVVKSSKRVVLKDNIFSQPGTFAKGEEFVEEGEAVATTNEEDKK